MLITPAGRLCDTGGVGDGRKQSGVGGVRRSAKNKKAIAARGAQGIQGVTWYNPGIFRLEGKSGGESM